MLYCIFEGNGSINVMNGVHRLPPVSNVEISVSNGIGVVASDFITWTSLSVQGVGKFSNLNILSN